MATTTRIPTSFRFQSSLLEELKERAKESNRSLNNYVENLLLNILHPQKKETPANTISPELQRQIEQAREEYKNGQTLHFETSEEMNAWLDSL